MMRIIKDGMRPADQYTIDRLRAKKYRINDLISITIRKTRKYWFHKKVHLFCRLVAQNVDGFSLMGAHSVLKKIQLEADIACESIMLNMPGIGPVSYRIPASVSFDDMDQGEFEEVYSRLCEYVSKTYWPGCSPEEIERMAGMMND